MTRETLIVQMTEGTTIIVPNLVWDLIKDRFQGMLDITYHAIEEYDKERSEQQE